MIVFQSKDSKFKCYQSELKIRGIQATALNGSAIFAPIFILKSLFKRKVRVYVFRYLNDYPSLFKTLLRLLSEFGVIVVSKIFGIKIWWLCHNVNKESIENYPKLTTVRRKLICKHSFRIITTSPLLEKYAFSKFRHSNISSISMGYIPGSVYNDMLSNSETDTKLLDWLKSMKKKNAQIIFCAGTPAKKALHFQLINSLLNVLNQNVNGTLYVALVVGAPVEKSPLIFNIPQRYEIKTEVIREYIDYYYRVMDDYSVSYTVYEAAFLRKPIITEDYGFLPEYIESNSIGISIKRDEALYLSEMIKTSKFAFSKFLKDNSWYEAGKRLEMYYNTDCLLPTNTGENYGQKTIRH